MSTPIAFGEKPCRFYWWIGSNVCDNCGKTSALHEGMAVLKDRQVSPFASGGEWVGLTWDEWRAHCDREAAVADARRAFDETLVRLGTRLGEA